MPTVASFFTFSSQDARIIARWSFGYRYRRTHGSDFFFADRIRLSFLTRFVLCEKLAAGGSGNASELGPWLGPASSWFVDVETKGGLCVTELCCRLYLLFGVMLVGWLFDRFWKGWFSHGFRIAGFFSCIPKGFFLTFKLLDHRFNESEGWGIVCSQWVLFSNVFLMLHSFTPSVNMK